MSSGLLGKMLTGGGPGQDPARPVGVPGLTDDLRSHIKRIAEAKEATTWMRALEEDDGGGSLVGEMINGYKGLAETATQMHRAEMEEAKFSQSGLMQLVGAIMQQSTATSQAARETERLYIERMLDRAQPAQSSALDKVVDHLLSSHPALKSGGQTGNAVTDQLQAMRDTLGMVKELNSMIPHPAPTAGNGNLREALEFYKFNLDSELRKYEIDKTVAKQDRVITLMEEGKAILKQLLLPLAQSLPEFMKERRGSAAAAPRSAPVPQQPAYEVECGACGHVHPLPSRPTQGFHCAKCGQYLRLFGGPDGSGQAQEQPEGEQPAARRGGPSGETPAGPATDFPASAWGGFAI
ncbi:MAG: hypothetical protein Q8R28_01830 [Dehalococcoidia bacterium]|nr:hypothetical protein [Dehalococcoidia bacterium]